MQGFFVPKKILTFTLANNKIMFISGILLTLQKILSI